MRILFLGLILFISWSSFIQKIQGQDVFAKEKIAGKNLGTGSTIKGKEYVFPDRIDDFHIDSTSGIFTVQLRGLSKNGKWLNNKGKLVQYSYRSKRTLWTKKIVYQVGGVQQFGNTLIHSDGNKSFCLDNMTGNKLWEVKNNMYFVDKKSRIGLGYEYKSTSGYSNDLEGINLNNGNVVWRRVINRENGWNDLFYSNDSTIIVIAGGLHSIHIKSGRGWSYNTITGKKDYKRNVATNAAGAAIGLLTGTFMFTTGHDVVVDLVSNAVADSSNFYFASKEQLAKIDRQNGRVIWKFPFPNDVASKSSIFLDDSMVYMVNKGMAYMGQRPLDFGKPFFAAFDKKTGKQKFMTMMEDKHDAVLSNKVSDGELFLVFKNKMAVYSMETGKMLKEKKFEKSSFGELLSFVGSQVFVTDKQGDLISLPQSDSTKVYVYTSQDKVLSIDRQLNLANTIQKDGISVFYLKSNGLRFVTKDKVTLLIDDAGKKIAKIDATSKAFLVGNTLYDVQDSSLIEIDLREFLK